jgi:exopolysaccharide production protein ExoY
MVFMPKVKSDAHFSLKRLFDIFFSLFAIIAFSPCILLCAVAIKCTSKGPIFYGSTRLGKDGKKIICWKLRTMHLGAEEMLQRLLASDPLLKKEWDQKYKLQKDVRITKIGGILRKTSLDELPQFWNVFKGDLSVVGPRPVTKEEAQVFIENKAEEVFSVRPGLTGLWQTSGRSMLSYQERIVLEQQYIKRQSFMLDLFLILKTIPSMIFPKGAF